MPLVLLAVVLTCTPPIAGQAPYSSLVQTACTVTDLRADPQCMFNLTTRAKCGPVHDLHTQPLAALQAPYLPL